MNSKHTDKSRILYVEGNVDGTIGGSYFSLLFLVAELDRSRFEPIVVFCTEHALLPQFHERGIRTIVRPPPRPVVARGIVGAFAAKIVNFVRGVVIEPLRLANLLWRERIAVVHLNNSITRNHSWMIAAKIARKRCITHERGINPQFKARDRRLGARLDAVICISAAVRDNFLNLGLGHLPLITIHNGLNPAEMRVTRPPQEVRSELGLSRDARIVGMVGNIKAWKGQEVVIRAMAMLRDEFPDVVCLLIGDTSQDDTAYGNKILALIDGLGLKGRVLVTGYRSDVANFVNILDIQIHASVAPEPFGRVLLEGMALSKPLVASGGGAVPEIVLDGVTGYLFDPGQPESLAQRLRILLGDRFLAEELGRKGRERLEEKFSITQNVKQTQALYEHLLVAKQ